MIARDKPVDGAVKILKLALRIATAWTLLSVLSISLWALLLEAGRRFGSGRASEPPAEEERQLSAEVRAIYADFGDDDGAGGEELADSERDETAASDHIVHTAGTASAGKR
jgi:hypothetical protein